ncbi:helix-turn-helix transcriptional regulator, partial [Actinomadura meridiana]|uniref:helix-turn-helix domain-containing protein n=1 Tax=Actinomadura meridiana TaxID=559626 RepID=UPI0031EA90E2
MREAKGVKQETIAHLTQVSGPQVSKIENGKKRATRSFVELVDEYLEANGALINLWEDLNKDGHPVPLWFDWPVRHEALHNRVEIRETLHQYP